MIEYPLKNLQIDQYLDKRCPDKTSSYNLIGVMVHLGSYHGGHYIAISQRNGKWYKFNDERVTKVKS